MEPGSVPPHLSTPLSSALRGLGDAKYRVYTESGDELPPGSFFVFRDSDILAVPGMWAYVHTVQTMIEMCEQGLVDVPPGSLAGLYTIRDFVSGLAATWQASATRRFPS